MKNWNKINLKSLSIKEIIIAIVSPKTLNLFQELRTCPQKPERLLIMILPISNVIIITRQIPNVTIITRKISTGP
jgi:hypothetical protein